MIALLAALEMEAAPARRLLRHKEHGEVGGFPLISGRAGETPVLLCRTGLGRRAGAAATVIIEQYRPAAIVSYGVAGALLPELHAGDLVLCDRTVAGEADGEPLTSDEWLLRLATRACERSGVANCTGTAGTVERVVREAERRIGIRDRTGAVVAEMEGYWVGESARQHRVPFLAVRSVLDEAERVLPKISGIVGLDGKSHALRVLPHIVAHPHTIVQLPWLAVAQRRSIRSLRVFLRAFIAEYSASPVSMTPQVSPRATIS